MKSFFIIIICAVLLYDCCAWAEEESFCAECFVYGRSELGRELLCYRVGDADASDSLLIVFGIHGFEDLYDRDAELLREIALKLIAHYEAEPIQGICLYVIPTANPDGLEEGCSCNGFGRLTASGIDPNRDFPVRWHENSQSGSTRNRTGAAPFSTLETRAIRDLVEKLGPDWGIDVHGYINTVYGSGKMADTFSRATGLKRRDCTSGGMMCQWFAQELEDGIMIEMPSFLPGKSFDSEAYIERNTILLIKGIDAWTAEQSKKQGGFSIGEYCLVL